MAVQQSQLKLDTCKHYCITTGNTAVSFLKPIFVAALSHHERRLIATTPWQAVSGHLDADCKRPMRTRPGPLYGEQQKRAVAFEASQGL